MSFLTKQQILSAGNNLVALMTFTIMPKGKRVDVNTQEYNVYKAELVKTLGIRENLELKVVVKENGKEDVVLELDKLPESFDLSKQKVTIEMPYRTTINENDEKAWKAARRQADAFGENKTLEMLKIDLDDSHTKIKVTNGESIAKLADFTISGARETLAKLEQKPVSIMPPPVIDGSQRLYPSPAGSQSPSPPPLPPSSSQPPPPSVPPPIVSPPVSSGLKPPLPASQSHVNTYVDNNKPKYTLSRASHKTPPPPPPREPRPKDPKLTPRIIRHPDHEAEVLRERAEAPKDPHDRSK